MIEEEKSYIYILTNKSFRDNLLKIGVSDMPMDELIEWLDSDDLPELYNPFAVVKTDKTEMLKEAFYRKLDSYEEWQYNTEYGFYILPPELAFGILFELVFEQNVDDAVVIMYKDDVPRQLFPPVNALWAKLEDFPDKD